MNEYPHSAFIPMLDTHGFITIPMNFPIGPKGEKSITGCIKLRQDEAKDLAMRIMKIIETEASNGKK